MMVRKKLLPRTMMRLTYTGRAWKSSPDTAWRHRRVSTSDFFASRSVGWRTIRGRVALVYRHEDGTFTASVIR